MARAGWAHTCAPRVDVTPNFKPPTPDRKANPAKAKAERDRLLQQSTICSLCGKARATDAHHVRKRSQGGDDTANNLKALCALCHELLDRNSTWAKQNGYAE